MTDAKQERDERIGCTGSEGRHRVRARQEQRGTGEHGGGRIRHPRRRPVPDS